MYPYECCRGCLMRSYRQVCLSLDFVKQCGVQTKFHGRTRTDASHYCGICEIEVRDGADQRTTTLNTTHQLSQSQCRNTDTYLQTVH